MTAIERTEYWAKRDDIDLFVLRKRPKGGGDLPVLFLVHGSSMGGPASYDLQVPSAPETYSLMDRFAEEGYDVWTMDHAGYGQSTRGKCFSTIAEGVLDLEPATEIVARETGKQAYAFFGQSSGALRAAAFAEAHPSRVERLVLAAFVWTGEGSPTLAKRREKLDQWRSSMIRPVDEAFYNTIFARDHPDLAQPEAAKALAAAELTYGDSVPTGTYIDMCANLPLVDPEKIHCPVQLIRGEHDGIASEEDLLAFWRKLPNMDKHYIVLAGQAHATQLDTNRRRFWHLLKGFLELPERLDPLAKTARSTA